jgi:hypothetical protein
MQLGNGLWETAAYNERQQVTMMGLGPTDSSQSLLRLDLEYGRLNLGTGQVDANTNNGSLAKQKISPRQPLSSTPVATARLPANPTAFCHFRLPPPIAIDFLDAAHHRPSFARLGNPPY